MGHSASGTGRLVNSSGQVLSGRTMRPDRTTRLGQSYKRPRTAGHEVKDIRTKEPGQSNRTTGQSGREGPNIEAEDRRPREQDTRTNRATQEADQGSFRIRFRSVGRVNQTPRLLHLTPGLSQRLRKSATAAPSPPQVRRVYGFDSGFTGSDKCQLAQVFSVSSPRFGCL